jgi:hypothetical protein
MSSHSYKHKVDAVIVGRGCDPHYVSASGVAVYRAGAGPDISAWTPPDASYGDQPTDADIAGVSDEAADDAFASDQTAIAQSMLTEDVVAASIVEVLSAVADEDVTAQVVAAIKAKL